MACLLRIARRSPTNGARETPNMRVLVLGGGCIGSVTAAELASRGHKVTLLDRVRGDDGELKPGNIAATNDDNKLVRLDYGADAAYTRLGVMSVSTGAGGVIPSWKKWPSTAFRQTGLLVLDDKPIDVHADGFAASSLKTLRENNCRVERRPVKSYEVFDEKTWIDSYMSCDSGWADCGQVRVQLQALLHSRALIRLLKMPCVSVSHSE
jgi:glycine/D-amino acid oxidase-like deaminating enzyme